MKALSKLAFDSLYQRLRVPCQYNHSVSNELSIPSEPDKVGASNGITIHQDHHRNFFPEIITPHSFITPQSVFLIPSGEHQVLTLDEQLTAQCWDIISRDEDSILASCTTYFNFINTWFPILTREELYDQILHQRGSPKGEVAILVLTIHLVSQLYQQVPRERSSLEQLYHTTKGLYFMFMSTGRSSIGLVQAGLLLAIYEHSQALHDATYQTLGACARMGYTLGFNKTLTQNILPDAKANSVVERQRQVWWGIIILER